MALISLTPEEQDVLEKVLTQFKFIVPLGHVEWYDLSERTQMTPQKTLSVLDNIKIKLVKEVKK
jgi:hypothetical protein